MAGTITHSWNGTILSITSDSGTTAMDLKGEKGDTGARGVRGLPGKAGGGARIEDGVISDETTWSSSGIVDRFAELMGTNANPAVLDNPYPNYPLQITTAFEPIQAGSGEPYPAGGGKNLLPYINISSGGFTSGGNGVFKYVSNNNTTISTFLFKAGITYTISATTVSGTGYKPCIIVRNPTGDKTGQKTNYGTTSNPLTFSFDTDTNFDIILQAETGNGLTTVNDSWAIQLEVGSTATEYAPYSNIRTISGWTGAKLTRCGKNLIPTINSSFSNHGVSYTLNKDGSITATGTKAGYSGGNGIFVSAVAFRGKTLTITTPNPTYIKVGLKLTNTSGEAFYIDAPHAEGSYTFTIPEEATTMAYNFYANTNDEFNYTFYPQLELGSTATTYEPYHGNTYTADFGQTVYGGTLDWQTGVLTADRALYTFDGSEGLTSGGWNNLYSYVLWGFLPDVVNCGMSEVADAYCSHYIVRSVANVITNAIAGFGIYDSGHLIFSSPTHADVDAFKAYLAAQHAAGTPVQVCYKLAEPQTIQLTPQEIKAIKGINTLYSNADELTVIGRVDTMYQLSKLAERVAALEAAIK